jgi:hypothetical protein
VTGSVNLDVERQPAIACGSTIGNHRFYNIPMASCQDTQPKPTVSSDWPCGYPLFPTVHIQF